MAIEKTRELNVSFPLPVKVALISEAQEQNRSLNDITVGILADHFKVPFEPTNRPYRGASSGGSGVVILRRVPARLDQRIEAEKSKRTRGKTKEAVVVSVVAEKYGIDLATSSAAA